jgi:hypothetical protein
MALPGVQSRTAGSAESQLPRVVLAIAAIVAAGLLASRMGYVPMWDGRVYADCIVQAVTGPFRLEELRCGGHASQVYVAYLAIFQWLAPASYVPMLVANTLLLAAGGIAFHRVLRLAFPSENLTLDCALLTAAFLLQPAILASLVQPGIDFPLVPELLWCLVFLLERRFLPAVLVGIAMAFTKETGLLLYGVLIACYGLWFALRPEGSIWMRIRALGKCVPLIAPAILFAAYLWLRARNTPTGTQVVWNATTTGEGFVHQFVVPRLDLYLINYLVMVLFMSFAWIASGTIALDAFVGTVRSAHRLGRRPLIGANSDIVRFLALVMMVETYAITRFATFGNSRYLVTLMALLLFPFLGALVRFGIPSRVRHAILATCAVAFGVSCIRTLDPVSRWLYGSFPVGSNVMLHMTSITKECCGLGRDQLSYNLEFTSLDALTQEALRKLPAIDSSAVVIPDSTSWQTIGPLNPTTRRRTLATVDTLMPTVLEPRDVVGGKARPRQLYYFALPYASAARGLADLETLYQRSAETRFERSGYSIPVHTLTRRDSVDAAAVSSAGSGKSR